jgi:hypothetical protein
MCDLVGWFVKSAAPVDSNKKNSQAIEINKQQRRNKHSPLELTLAFLLDSRRAEKEGKVGGLELRFLMVQVVVHLARKKLKN